jgi:CheY-like chemotaxis protein
MSETSATILIVDDEVHLRGFLRALLEKAGHVVLEAADGNEGLEVFRSNEIDMVIADMLMPQKEGPAMISELRQESPDLKIVGTSGATDKTTRLQMARTLGADAIISKPFQTAAFLELTERLLSE